MDFRSKKKDKIACETQYRLAEFSSLGLHDSSEVNSSEDAEKNLPCMTSLTWEEKRKILPRFEILNFRLPLTSALSFRRKKNK